MNVSRPSLRPRAAGAMLHPVWFTLLLTGCYWISDAERDARWDLDGDGVERPLDCDDADPELSENQIFDRDGDGDGYGDLGEAIEACAPPEGYVADSTDCDDTLASIHPGAVEQCNQVDDDCDLAVDEDTAVVRFYRDADGDGAGDLEQVVEACVRPEGYVALGDDCDDTNPYVNPDAPEVCNGYDDDCDEDVDLDDSSLDLAQATWYLDDDGDQYGRDDRTELSCDPVVGHVQVGGDCNDGNVDIHPGADEVCNDVDDDCNGYDDDNALDALRLYPDNDGDSFGDPDVPVDSCDPLIGYVYNAGDCDDAAPQSNPSAEEWCASGEDEDCDGNTDEVDCVPPPPPDSATTGHTGDTGGGS